MAMMSPHPKNIICTKGEYLLCNAIVCWDTESQACEFVIQGDKIAMYILGAFWARNNAAAKEIQKMGAYLRGNRVEFGKNQDSRWTLPAALEKKVQIGAESESDVVLARETAMGELFTIYNNLLSAVLPIKDV
jgi:hypothetical protein